MLNLNFVTTFQSLFWYRYFLVYFDCSMQPMFRIRIGLNAASDSCFNITTEVKFL
jgi:hypothetical protein